MESSATQPNSRAVGNYKFQRLRECLRQAIETGQLAGKLPGERELARRYKANAKTISKALTDLSCEGLLVRHVGRGTFVTDQLDERVAPGRPKRFRWLVGAEVAGARSHAIFESASERVRRAGHRIQLHRVHADDAGRIPAGWLSPGLFRELDGVIISSSNPSHELVADLHRRHIPLVLANCTAETIKCNMVRPDFARGAFELTEQLIWAEHRRIALVMPRRCSLARREAERGYRAAMDRYGLTGLEILPDEPAALATAAKTPDRPTGLISHTRESETRIRHAWREAGVRADPPVATAMLKPPEENPVPTRAGMCYSFDTETYVDWAVRLLLEATPGHQPREVILPGRLSGSLVRPAAGRPPDNHVSAPGMVML